MSLTSSGASFLLRPDVAARNVPARVPTLVLFAGDRMLLSSSGFSFLLCPDVAARNVAKRVDTLVLFAGA